MADVVTLQADLVLYRKARDAALSSGKSVRVRGHEVEFHDVPSLERTIVQIEQAIASLSSPRNSGYIVADVAKGTA